MTNEERAEIVEKYLHQWEHNSKLDTFTPKAKTLMFNAARLAMYMGDEKIGTEHILLAGTELKKSEIYYNLTSYGITAERVIEKIKKARKIVNSPTYLTLNDLSIKAQLVIDYAQILSDVLISTGDILMGMYAYNCAAFQLMRNIFKDIKKEKEIEE